MALIIKKRKMENEKIHAHPGMEKRLNVPNDHCIVDRKFVDKKTYKEARNDFDKAWSKLKLEIIKALGIIKILDWLELKLKK